MRNADSKHWTDAHEKLITLAKSSGLRKAGLARALGIDEGKMRDYLPADDGPSEPSPIPPYRNLQIHAVQRIDARRGERSMRLAHDEIAVVMRR